MQFAHLFTGSYQRLPAEELAKTKWIKSVSKVGTSILQDVIRRLEQAGRRASLAEPLDWEADEERECVSSLVKHF